MIIKDEKKLFEALDSIRASLIKRLDKINTDESEELKDKILNCSDANELMIYACKAVEMI